MDDLNCNANDYSAFLEGVATRREQLIIMKKMLRDQTLIMELNLAAAVTIMDLMEEGVEVE